MGLYTTSHTYIEVFVFIYFCYNMLLYSWGRVCNEEFNVQFRVQSQRDAGQIVLRNTYYLYVLSSTNHQLSVRVLYISLMV